MPRTLSSGVKYWGNSRGGNVQHSMKGDNDSTQALSMTWKRENLNRSGHNFYWGNNIISNKSDSYNFSSHPMK